MEQRWQENSAGRNLSEIVAKALAIVDSFSDERRDDPAVFDRLAKKFAGFTTEELQFLIAENLQSQLPELIYVTQVIHDQKVLTAPKDDMRKRLEEAKSFTFIDYNREDRFALMAKTSRGSPGRSGKLRPTRFLGDASLIGCVAIPKCTSCTTPMISWPRENPSKRSKKPWATK